MKNKSLLSFTCFIALAFSLSLIITKNALAIPNLLSCAQSTDIKVCFTPGGNCTEQILDAIDNAKQSIYVQAYSFTSPAIIKTLNDTHNRGIDVKILLDKSQVNATYSSATYLYNHKIWFKIDNKPAIAHNKIMIIDGSIVITGSFNFTKAAQERNAENVIFIDNEKIAQEYLKNWNKREQESVDIKEYRKIKHLSPLLEEVNL